MTDTNLDVEEQEEEEESKDEKMDDDDDDDIPRSPTTSSGLSIAVPSSPKFGGSAESKRRNMSFTDRDELKKRSELTSPGSKMDKATGGLKRKWRRFKVGWWCESRSIDPWLFERCLVFKTLKK